MIDCILACTGRHLHRHWVAWFLASLLLFLTFPQIDLAVSGWFWSPDGGWIHGRDPLPEFVRKGLPAVLVGAVLYLTVLWAAGRVLKTRFWGITGPKVWYLWSSLILGPGLIVNAVFKENWGRARPSQITEFGGDAVYTPPFMIADQCTSNCSFMSGHGALGFWITAFAFLVPAPWRGRALLAALVLGAAVGLVRILQGGHFFSDVVYAGVVTVTLNWALYRWLVVPRTSAARVET